MSLYHVIGSKLLAPEDATKEHGRRPPRGLEALTIAVPGAQPIGTGKPLSIIIRHVYTGRYPKGSAFGAARRDVLLSSAVRDVFTSFNAAPRAVNIVKRRIPAHSDIGGPAATENGTPL